MLFVEIYNFKIGKKGLADYLVNPVKAKIALDIVKQARMTLSKTIVVVGERDQNIVWIQIH